MAKFRDRIKIIQELKKTDLISEKPKINKKTDERIFIKGWEQCGYQVLKREIIKNITYKIQTPLPMAIKVIIPDLFKYEIPQPKDFLFFDLETTGLSGGAGTVAFLAAFGRYIINDDNQEMKLQITQYLLLDYPGQNDFLTTVLKEFDNNNSVIVSYNGKSFDSQILKNMCLMNSFKPPEYKHIDLLHPARRLWKNINGDCSQASIETNILGISREGDIPGALAPEIWFEFLKTGKTDKLIGICDHNISDIEGLSCILSAIITIADDPLQNKFNIDIPRLAFFWRQFCCYGKKYLLSEYKDILAIGVTLLKHTECSNYGEEIKKEAARFLSIYEKRWKKMTPIIDELNKKEINKYINLVYEVFDEFVGIDYSDEGKNTFKDYLNTKNISERMNNKDNRFFIAKCSNEIIGLLETRNNDHISLFFVKKEYHNKRIGKKLFLHFLELIKNENIKIEKITVNSSIYAVNIYNRLGFEKIGELQEKNGIKFIPMEYTITA